VVLFGIQCSLKLSILRSVFYSKTITQFWGLQQLIALKMTQLNGFESDPLLHQLMLELYDLFLEINHSNGSIFRELLMIIIII
jgi:hypothetical protein